MKLDLLWWRHRRPSIHVADHPILDTSRYIMDISPILTDLNNPNPLVDMLMLLGTRPITSKISESKAFIFPVGSYMRKSDDGRLYRVKSHHRSNDWFDDQIELILEGAHTRSRTNLKIEWLEDNCMPLLCSRNPEQIVV